MRDAFLAASAEAEAAFGDAGMYLEKAVLDAHHIEIQVLGDGLGGGLVLGERECSIQRRHQKLIEESPSPFLAPETLVTMEAAATDALRALSYAGAGTIEFLVGADQAFYFMEMNTRLQVEHPVTEEVTAPSTTHIPYNTFVSISVVNVFCCSRSEITYRLISTIYF